MTYFAVDTLKINNQMESLSGISRELLIEAKEIKQLALDLDSDMEGIRHVKVFLSALSDETKRNASSMKNLQNALSSVLSLYEKTEKKLAGDSSLSSNNNAHSSDESNADTSSIDKYMSLLGQLFLILPGYLSPIVWINLISCASAETLHFFLKLHGTIDDETFKGFLENPLLVTAIADRYYSHKNTDSKKLFEKYLEKLKVNDFKYEGTSYYSRDDRAIYINAFNELTDPRGYANVFYHEYAHMIVTEAGFIDSSGNYSEGFQKFNDAMRSDVSSYISDIENKYRDEFLSSNPDASEADITRYVENSTRDELANILGGENKDCLNGVSDMIDSISNGKYRITYSHTGKNPDYWTDNPTRVPNEAFAQCFAADLRGDTEEYKFMCDKFPNMMKAYNELVSSAV